MTKAHLRFEARQSRQTQPYASPGPSWGSALLEDPAFCALNAFPACRVLQIVATIFGSNCELYFVIAKEFGGRNVV